MAYQRWESFKFLCSICHTKRLWAQSAKRNCTLTIQLKPEGKKEGLSSWQLKFAALWSWLCFQPDTDFSVIFGSHLQTTMFSTLHNCYWNSEGAAGHRGSQTTSALKVKGKAEEEELGERFRWFKSFSVLASPAQVPRDLPGILLKISHPFVMAENSGPQKGIIEYGNLCFSSYIITRISEIA